MTLTNFNSADTIETAYSPSILNYGESSLALDRSGESNVLPQKSFSDQQADSVLSGDWVLSGEWVSKVVKKLNNIRNLPDNWNGYGGRKLDGQVYLNVHRFLREMGHWILPEPDLIPGSGGGVQFEWRCNHRELEIEFSESGQIGTLKVEADNSMEESSFNIEELWKVGGLLTWLRGQ